MKKKIQRWLALLWQYIDWARYRFYLNVFKYKNILFIGITFIFVCVSVYFSPRLQIFLETNFATEKTIEGLRGLLLNSGSALIGVTAIVASLILFAMQVNIERMPYGLFQCLSSDFKLLSTFALAFILAITVATLSIFIDKNNLAYVLISSLCLIIFILSAFVYAYHRALILINPLRQLELLLRDTNKGLKIWARRAQRVAPLIELKENETPTQSSNESTHDLARTVYFQLNSSWTDKAKRSIRHAMSYAQRYAEHGDYEVSGVALKVILGINAAYIDAKGKTFYASVPFFDNPFASDSLINDTLECLRENVQSGITRRDEQQIKQIFQTMAALVPLYLAIDYSSPYGTKDHAVLASRYLVDAVQAAVPQAIPDVLMEGVQLMGQSALRILAKGKLNDIVILIEKITLISCIWSTNEKYRPVTMLGVTQLANITIGLLYLENQNIHFMCEDIRNNVSLIAKLFLNIPSTPLSNALDFSLGPCYFSLNVQNLRNNITKLVNDILKLENDNAMAKSIIQNIERWAEGLYKTEKDIFIVAINVKSSFILNIIYWVTGVTEILLAVSNAPACDAYTQHELQDHALWLISILSWVPDDKESVVFVENYQMTENLFEAAMNARKRECGEVAKRIREIFLSWALKAAKYREVRGVLEQGLCGLAAIGVMDGDEGISWVKKTILGKMNTKAITQEIRNEVAIKILERAANLYDYEHSFSQIDRMVAAMDHDKMVKLLEEIVSLLSPELAAAKHASENPSGA